MQTYRTAAFEVARRIAPASVRANAYQHFVLGLTRSMEKSVTNSVSDLLARAREDGRVPWEWIIDENQSIEGTPSWDDPAAFSDAVTAQFRLDRWTQQSVRVEVWSEKGTVRGTLGPVLREYGVTFKVLGGYGSADTVHKAVLRGQQDGRPLIVLYIGDYDPSATNMSEADLPGRLAKYGRVNVTLRRLAITADDVADPALPGFSVETQ